MYVRGTRMEPINMSWVSLTHELSLWLRVKCLSLAPTSGWVTFLRHSYAILPYWPYLVGDVSSIMCNVWITSPYQLPYPHKTNGFKVCECKPKSDSKSFKLEHVSSSYNTNLGMSYIGNHFRTSKVVLSSQTLHAMPTTILHAWDYQIRHAL